MNLKRLLKQTLLVAMMLTGGGNFAWADSTLYEKGTTDHAWTNDDLDVWTLSSTDEPYYKKINDSNYLEFGLSASANGRYAYTATKSLTTSPDYRVNLNMVWNVGTCTGKINATNNYMQIGDVIIRFYGQNSRLTIKIGSADAVDVMVGSADNNNSTLRNKDMSVSLTINKKTKAVSYTISSPNWNGGTAISGTGASATGDVSSIVFSSDRGGQQWRNANQYIKSLVITEEEDVSATANYTVLYKSGDTEIKESETRTGVVGNPISLLATDKNFIRYSNVKYLYSSDDAEGKTIASDGSTVVTVSFTEAPTYTYSVTDNLGNTIANGSAYEGDNVGYFVPYYVFKGGKFYHSPTLSVGTRDYGSCTISSISANTDVMVTYVEEENTNVFFFSEAEELTDAKIQNDSYTNQRMSNGKAGYFSEETAFVTLPAGVYTIESSTRAGTTDFYLGVAGSGIKVYSISSSGSVTTTTSDPFTLTEETDIYTSTGNSSKYFDYVLIRKIGKVTKEITAAGWATLYTPYALDFSGVTGLEAYTATCTNNKVTLTKVDDVPANSGVVLKGAANNYSIPVIASSTTDKGELTGSATAATAWNAYDGYNLYMLALNANSEAQFTKVTSGSIAAGKAFLKLSNSASRSLTVVVGDEATGVQELKDSSIEGLKTGDCYNLKGQRVSQPTKGLYIVNGKKVVINK